MSVGGPEEEKAAAARKSHNAKATAMQQIEHRRSVNDGMLVRHWLKECYRDAIIYRVSNAPSAKRTNRQRNDDRQMCE